MLPTASFLPSTTRRKAMGVRSPFLALIICVVGASPDEAVWSPSRAPAAPLREARYLSFAGLPSLAQTLVYHACPRYLAYAADSELAEARAVRREPQLSWFALIEYGLCEPARLPADMRADRRPSLALPFVGAHTGGAERGLGEDVVALFAPPSQRLATTLAYMRQLRCRAKMCGRYPTSFVDALRRANATELASSPRWRGCQARLVIGARAYSPPRWPRVPPPPQPSARSSPAPCAP